MSEIDYNKMRYEAGWKGFKEKDYGKMYEYLFLRAGNMCAEFFKEQNKKYKRCFCARVVHYFHPNPEYKKKATKYYHKHRGEFEL